MSAAIALIADTHMPRGRRRLPDACVEALESAELIVHAGDILTSAVLAQIGRHGELAAVAGNNDEPALRRRLPQRLELELQGHRVGVTHDGGPASGRLARLRRSFPEAAMVVFGHSHMPLHEAGKDGFQIVNPGSPTEPRRAPAPSMALLHAEPGGLRVEIVPLEASLKF